jgi:tryptophan synthase alpha chain
MSRIADKFEKLKAAGEKGFIPFITAGDPDPGCTLELLKVFDRFGAAVIELGVPFSDPMADGPVIQASSQRALDNHNIGITDVLNIVSEFRQSSETPVVLFGYLNPFFQYGIDELSTAAAGAGVDGLLVTDIVDDDFIKLAAQLSRHELDLITLIAPTTSETRLAALLGAASGFVYAISTTGITGNKGQSTDEARDLVKRARRYTDIPVAVGFGISTAADVERVIGYADAAVVGSAIVKRIADSHSCSQAISDVGRFVGELLGQDSALAG